MSRILLVEDEAVIRSEARRLLTRHGYEVVEAESVTEALALAPETFHLIISDLRLPGGPGTELIHAVEGAVPVVIMTAFATVRSAVEAMKFGAVDYISKPFDSEELLELVRRHIHPSSEVDEAADGDEEGMVAGCTSMREVINRLRRVAPTHATVLILGESGTGKELVARALHERSARRDGAFVAVNCAAIPEGLIESELFGHEKGAFTGAEEQRDGLVTAAHGGTLFLDEVGELPLAAQARLLRVLQESEVRQVGSSQVRKVDVRVVSATHRDLPAMVRAQAFREDLYFRLKVVDIHLPPLRDRGDDVVRLARRLLDRICERLGRNPPPLLGPAALSAIQAHRWPGNVRELENALERAVILSDGVELEPSGLGLEPVLSGFPNGAGGEPGSRFGSVRSPSEVTPPSVETAVPEASLTEYFRTFVVTHQAELSETEIAKRLGISRKALWERRRRLGIPRPKSNARAAMDT